ncbi:caspase domain-containing protein [Pyxidicoccus sp. 3LG]
MPVAPGWAIVIGVSRYWQDSRCLDSAVTDALRFRDWVLEPTGGALDPKRVYLLLSPMPGAVGPELQRGEVVEPEASRYAEATHDNIVRAVNDLRKRCQLEENQGRIYFFFSGHQITARVAFADQEAILPTDFTPELTTRAMELRTITECLLATGRPEQFVFIDGCRDVPWERKEQRIGGMPEACIPNPRLPAPQQYIFFATSPRQKAYANQVGLPPHGLFTQALLEGLRGKGSAKVWSSARRRYLVRVFRLLDFIVKEVASLSLKLSEGEIEQVPRLGGEKGARSGSDLILMTLRAEDVPPESLTVSVAPEECQPHVTLMVERDNQFVAESAPSASHPVAFTLPPREYSVLARAVRYEPSEEFWPIELYEPSHVAITMKKSEVEKHILYRTLRAPRYLAGDAWFEHHLGPLRQEQVPPASLFVEAWDSRLFVRVADASGEPVGQELGAVSLEGANPGFYRAEVFGPEGRLESRLFELFGHDERIRMDEPSQPPDRLLQAVLQAVRAKRDTRTIWEVPGMGYVPLPRLSTILTAVGYASVGKKGLRGDLPSGDALGLPASIRASGPSATLYLLFAAESEAGETSLRFLESVRARLWPVGQPMPGAGQALRCGMSVKGVADCLLTGAAGPTWLSLEVPGQPAMVLPVMLEAARVNLVVVESEVREEPSPEGRVTVAVASRIFRYCPDLALKTLLDYPSFRILEADLAQRCLGSANDAYRLALVDAERRPGDLDPLGACAAGYLLLRHERKDALRSLLERLEQRGFHGPDAVVLRAALEGHPPGETLERLGSGLPLFSEGLLHLRHMVQDLDAPRTSELTRLAAGRLELPWTAFPASLLLPEPP